MEIKRIDSQPTRKGPAEWFTGSVRIQPMFDSPRTGTCAWRERHVRAGCAHCLAFASARSDVDRYVRSWLGAA